MGESVTKSIVLPPECGKGMGKICVAPMMDDVESRALISENQGLAPRPLGA